MERLDLQKVGLKKMAPALAGIVGGSWAFQAVSNSRSLLEGTTLSNYYSLFVLHLFTWFLPPLIISLSIIAGILMALGQHRHSGLMNIVSSQLLLVLLALFIASGLFPSAEMPATLGILTFYWLGPFVLLFSSALLGMRSARDQHWRSLNEG